MDTHLISNNLLNLRQSRNWSQRYLADILQISRQAISKWETGASLPDLDTLLKLSQLFNITINEILAPIAKNYISDIEEIPLLDKTQLKTILKAFSSTDIVKASMGASPKANDILRHLFKNIDFDRQRTNIGSIKITELKAIHSQIVNKINLNYKQNL